VPTAGLFSSLETVINIETNCNTALLIVVCGLGWGSSTVRGREEEGAGEICIKMGLMICTSDEAELG